jgi:transposase
LPAPAFHPLGCHNPCVPDRDAMDAILLVLRTGMQWNALDASGIRSSSSAHRRFQEWRAAGVFAEIWCQRLLEYDEVVGIEWAWLAADGAMTKAPGGLHARLDPDQAPEGDKSSTAGRLPRQGLRQRRSPRARRRLQADAAHPRPRRGDRRQAAHSRLTRSALDRRGKPQLVQPQPRRPDPLVEERRKPPRPAPTRQRPDRLQESSPRNPRRRPTGIGP